MSSVTYFVDFSTSTSGDGSTLNPFTLDQFISDVQTTVAADTVVYKAKGDGAVHTNIIVSDSANMVLTNWEGQSNVNEPWTLKMLSGSSVQSRDDGDTRTLRILNGRMIFDDEGSTAPYFRGEYFLDNYHRPLIMDNMHLHFYSGEIEFRDYKELTITNSTLITSAGTGTIKLYYAKDDGTYPTYKFHNSIFQDIAIEHEYVASPGVAGQTIEFNQVVTNLSAIDDNITQGGAATRGVTITSAGIQLNWDVDDVLQTYEVSAITSADLNYLTSSFNEITIDGDSSLSDSSASNIYGGTRDGVGALYFPTIDFSVSANPQSGTSPLETDISFAPLNTKATFSGDSLSYGAAGIAGSNDKIAIMNTNDGVHLYNISGSNIVSAASYSTIYAYRGGVDLSAGYVFASLYQDGLFVFNDTDLTLIDSIDNGYSLDVSVEEIESSAFAFEAGSWGLFANYFDGSSLTLEYSALSFYGTSPGSVVNIDTSAISNSSCYVFTIATSTGSGGSLYVHEFTNSGFNLITSATSVGDNTLLPYLPSSISVFKNKIFIYFYDGIIASYSFDGSNLSYVNSATVISDNDGNQKIAAYNNNLYYISETGDKAYFYVYDVSDNNFNLYTSAIFDSNDSASVSVNENGIFVGHNYPVVYDVDDFYVFWSSATYTFGDGDTSASTLNHLAHTYDSIGTYNPSITVSAKNNWYSVNNTISQSVTVGAISLSGNIVIVDAETSASITSAYINNTVAVSSTYLSGSPTSYDVFWGDGTSSLSETVTDNRIYTEHTYNSRGDYNVSAIISNNTDPDVTLTTNITIEEVSQRTFYVDINRSYDTTASNSGTSGNPLDYGEFISKIAVGSDGVNYDTFKLKGFRELSATNEIININTSANYIIDAWDLSAYGPWMICKDDNYLSDQIMSFIGARTIGGLYYNKPKFGSEGSRLNISNLKNMYIVNQGSNSYINSYIYETDVSAVSAYYSYINDDFANSAVDDWWSSDFYSNAEFSTVDDDVVLQTSAPTKITETSIDSDVLLEFSTYVKTNFSLSRSYFYVVDSFGTSARIYHKPNDRLGFTDGSIDVYYPVSYNMEYFYVKLESKNNSLSAAYRSDTSAAWTYFTSAIPFSGAYDIILDIDNIDDFLSYVNVSAVNKISDESNLPYQNSYNYLISAFEGIDIVGCTVYTDSGFKIDREYSNDSLSAISANFNITDSVIKGMEVTGSTSAVSLVIRNNTFDKSYSDISGSFDVSANLNNQFSWIPPSSYPFTIGAGSNYGYNQDLFWLSANPSKIAPFDGITSPPNPGYNFSAYPGYETGLFGYDRSNY